MRTYLVVMDETPEARVALRFAARRAARTGGAVDILAPVPRAEFVQWGAVQAAMDEEARLRAEALVTQAARNSACALTSSCATANRSPRSARSSTSGARSPLSCWGRPPAGRARW